MKAAPYNMLLEAASRYNILTLTTSCAAACVFCSHHQNPREVEAYYINKLTLEEAENLIEFLDGDSKITIGESATRICEGEPFAFEYILNILRSIRAKYPNAPIQITSSGINMDSSILSELQEIQNVELNISLNSCSEEGRKKLYGGKSHMKAVQAVALLKKYNIAFNGSIVAMPHVVGWEDLEQTVAYLALHGASTVRIFVPGYTRYTAITLPEEDIGSKLQNMAKAMQDKAGVPVIVEPAVIESLFAVVEGVVPASPAYQAGFKAGDIILAINDKAVYSRVDAYNRIISSANPEISFQRDGKSQSCVIVKDEKSSSGLVFNYDIDPEAARRIQRKVDRLAEKKCLMLVSKLGYGIISNILENNESLEIKIAPNNYFGGNIMCAGLLVLNDIEDVLKQADKLPEVVFLPQVMFDDKGRDLTGRHYIELEQQYQVAIVVI